MSTKKRRIYSAKGRLRLTPYASKIQRAYRKHKKKRASTLARQNKTKINKLMNSQATWYDYFLSISPSSAGVINELGLLNIVIGNNPNQRYGNKIELKGLSMKSFIFTINGMAANADAFNNVRVIIFTIPQAQVPLPNLNAQDILQNLDVLSHYKKDSRVKYKILFDSMYYVDNQASPGQPRWAAVQSHQKFCATKITWPKGLSVEYDANGDISKNNVLMLAISDSSVLPHPSIQGRVRLLYQP